MVPEEQTHEHQPLRQQEERGREHAGHRPADGQRLPAQGCHGARALLLLLRPAHHSHQSVTHPANYSGSAPDIPW